MAFFGLFSLILIITNILLIYFFKKVRDKNFILKHQLDLKSYQLLSQWEEKQDLQAIKTYQDVIFSNLEKHFDEQEIEKKIIEVVCQTLEICEGYFWQFNPNLNQFYFKYYQGIQNHKTDHITIQFSQIEIHPEDIKQRIKNINLIFNVNPAFLTEDTINLLVEKEDQVNNFTPWGIFSFNLNKDDLFDSLKIEFIKHIISIFTYSLESNKNLELLEKAIDSSLNGIVITDASQPHNPVIYINRGFEIITGYTKEETLGKNCSFLQNNDHQQNGIKKLRKAIQSGKKCRTVIKNYRKNGELFWNEIYINPIYNEEGDLTHFIGVQNDITKKYNLEQALSKKTKQLANFSKKLKAVNELKENVEVDLSNNLNYYLKNACHILNMQIGIIVEVSTSQFEIVSQYCTFNSDLFFHQQYCLINILSQEVVKKQETIYDESTSSFSLISSQNIAQNLSITSYLATPIWLNDEIYGTMHLFSVEKTDHYLIYQKHLIEAIALNISRNILAQEKELEKEHINIALVENQERLNGILSSLEDVIWSIHPQTLQLMYINNAAKVLYECELSFFFQKRCFWLDLVHPGERETIKAVYSNILSVSLFDEMLNNHDLEYKIILPNGNEKYIRDRAYVIYNEQKKVIRIDGIMTDISKQKEIQQALMQSEEELRLIFDSAPIGMMITDQNGIIQRVNNSVCQLLNYNFTDLINQNQENFYHPDDVEKNKLLIKEISNNNQEKYSQERRYLASNGTVIYTIVDVSILKNNQGKTVQLIQQIIDISQVKNMEEQILFDKLYDKLTGLPNRFLFLERLEKVLTECTKNADKLCAVLLIDIDNFQKINDSLGHNIGDELLIIIADKIINCLRKKDTLARISGDEFAVLLHDLTSYEQGEIITQNIITTCNTNHLLDNNYFASSVTVGVTFSSLNYEDKEEILSAFFGYQKPEEMLRDADLTMNQAKKAGKNCYQIFKPIMYKQLLEKLKLESQLRKALHDGILDLYYQPIINLKTNNIAGFEALVRWFHPELGSISPVKFIPIAEENGLIIPLGDWILNTAAHQAHSWHKKYPDLNLFIAVNVSGKQLLDEHFLDKVDLILNKSEVNPLNLKLEITESILMDNFNVAKTLLDKIQARDLKISLDDFGTGYSSLSYLHRLPFNTLKIDRAFITPLNNTNNRHAIVEAIVALAHNLSLDVVAEGIETTTQEAILKRIGCDFGQGYLYSQPVDATGADNLINLFNRQVAE